MGWKGSPRMGAVNHLSMANTTCRNVWTKLHSSFTDWSSRSAGRLSASAIVLAHSSSRAAHPSRMPTTVDGVSIDRSGYQGSRSLT